MLPINTNTSRDTVKSEQISTNSAFDSEQTTGNDYQEILSSLEQEHGAADDTNEHEPQALSAEQETVLAQTETVTTDKALQQQVVTYSSEVLAKETAPASVTDARATTVETARQTSMPVNSPNNEPAVTAVGQAIDSEETLEQAPGQLPKYRSGATVNENLTISDREANKTDITLAQNGQPAKDFLQPLTADTTGTTVPGSVDAAKQAEQASQASGQAVSLVYRQQELYGSSRLSGEQMLTEQHALSGTKPLANGVIGANKTDGMATAMLNQQILTDVRAVADLPGARTGAEVQTITSAQSQSQTLAMDTTLADRSQTAAGKYEWSMLKLDSQKQNWSRQLFNTLQDRIEMQVNQQIKQAKIRLDPPELGRLELMVRIEGDRMSVNVQASNSAVRDALLETNDRLRQELANQFGSSVDVNVGSDSSGEEFKNEEQLVAVSNVEATEKTQTSVPLTTGWLNALA